MYPYFFDPYPAPIHEIRRAYTLAVLRRTADRLEQGFWVRGARLTERCQAAREREERLYATRFDARVANARRRLAAMFGSASDEPEATDWRQRLAVENVQVGHYWRLRGIDAFETRHLERINKADRDFERQLNSAPVYDERVQLPPDTYPRLRNRRQEH